MARLVIGSIFWWQLCVVGPPKVCDTSYTRPLYCMPATSRDLLTNTERRNQQKKSGWRSNPQRNDRGEEFSTIWWLSVMMVWRVCFSTNSLLDTLWLRAFSPFTMWIDFSQRLRRLYLLLEVFTILYICPSSMIDSQKFLVWQMMRLIGFEHSSLITRMVGQQLSCCESIISSSGILISLR